MVTAVLTIMFNYSGYFGIGKFYRLVEKPLTQVYSIVLRSQKYGKQSGVYETGFALSVVSPLKFSTQATCIAFVVS
jgi:hypothetical protein